MNNTKKKHKRMKLWITAVAGVLLIIMVSCTIYLNDYYRADQKAIDEFSPTGTISQKVLDDNTIVYEPKEAKVGFIFYPGGKVEYTAYEPLMEACASKGILCVLVEMPFHLAVLDVNAADGIQEQYPGIENWYIGGHSLGGAMAASYISKHVDAFEGLVLLGSYSTADLSDTSLEVLSIYGSEDKVLNQEKYEDNKSNLPENYSEVIIKGGCHSYFGMYGQQDGDGSPTITGKEQINQTVDVIGKFIGKYMKNNVVKLFNKLK